MSDKKLISYFGLAFVLLVWGAGPLLTLELYKFYSPTFRMFFSECVLLIAYLIISGKHIKKLNMKYVKAGFATGIFLALANISQKIGLLYTTPARYSFLENLSVITVPIVMYIFTKKKPGLPTVVACVICLLSAFVLNGGLDGSAWGAGEILCAVSGLLYGFNIAGAALFAKELHAPLYLAMQSVIGIVTSLIFSLVLNFVSISGAPIEPIVFSLKPEHLLFAVLLTLVSSALCWIIRTNALKHIDATVVSVIMPFASVVTGLLSVMAGKDTLDFNLICGALLGLVAMLLPGIADMTKKLHNK